MLTKAIDQNLVKKNGELQSSFYTLPENIPIAIKHWCMEKSLKNKKLLLMMAQNGESRPKQGKHPLGRALSHYISKKSTSYDEVFHNNIVLLAPYWFKVL